MYISLTAAVLTSVVVAGCLFALWKGGPGERSGASVILANLVILRLFAIFLPAASYGLAELAVDGLTAMALLVLVLRFASLWLGGVMLLYALQFSSHAFYMVTERPADRLHAIINNLDFTGVVVCLVTGTAVAWRRRVRTAQTSAA
jgi:hypothetical protein